MRLRYSIISDKETALPLGSDADVVNVKIEEARCHWFALRHV